MASVLFMTAACLLICRSSFALPPFFRKTSTRQVFPLEFEEFPPLGAGLSKKTTYDELYPVDDYQDSWPSTDADWQSVDWLADDTDDSADAYDDQRSPAESIAYQTGYDSRPDDVWSAYAAVAPTLAKRDREGMRVNMDLPRYMSRTDRKHKLPHPTVAPTVFPANKRGQKEQEETLENHGDHRFG